MVLALQIGALAGCGNSIAPGAYRDGGVADGAIGADLPQVTGGGSGSGGVSHAGGAQGGTAGTATGSAGGFGTGGAGGATATGGAADASIGRDASGSPDAVGAGGSGTAGTGGSPGAGGALAIGPGLDGGIPSTAACPTPTGTAVTLTQTSGGFVVSNGLVTVTIANDGNLIQASKNGKDLMSAGQTMYVSESGGTSYHAITATSHAVVQQSSEIVELSFSDTSGAPLDMDWDLHYIVRRGVSGFYYFLGTQVGTATHPGPATLSELRSVQRFDEAVLSNGYSGERHGPLPRAAQLGTEVQNAAYLLAGPPNPLPTVSSLPGVTGQNYDEGPVFTKYDWSSYRSEDPLHGLYGNGFGAWMLSPSWEFYTGAALKQELMVQDGTLLLNMYHGGHAGSATTTPSPVHWRKIYGPNLVYINTGTTDAQIIADAKAQFAIEQGQWPYCWMKNADYPLSAERGTVTGKIVEAHGRSIDGVMVTLAQDGPLLSQGYDYMFWTQADANGRFSIPAVRQGTYSVHVYATQGTITDDPTNGEIAGTVTVVAGANDVGTLIWSPPYHANLVWSIGNSDRKSGEFRVFSTIAAGAANTAYETGRMYGPAGSADVGLWTVPPANTTYKVGTSTPQTDWYFAQSATGTWTVEFTLASVPAGGATLTIAIAGAARTPHLVTSINGHQVLTMAFGNDQSLYRSCLEGGAFQLVTANVPVADLVAGANVATFAVTATGGAGIFYDMVKLESD
jgi:rhamnogalacturonan endolyase